MIHLHNPEGSGRTGRNKISFLYNPSLAFSYLSKNGSDPSLLPSLLPCCIVLTSDGTSWPQASPAPLALTLFWDDSFCYKSCTFPLLGFSRGYEPTPASFSQGIQTLLSWLSTSEWWVSPLGDIQSENREKFGSRGGGQEVKSPRASFGGEQRKGQ